MMKRVSTAAVSGVLLAVAIVGAACGPGAPAATPPVPTDWPQANHDYANTRVATGSPISSANVRRLGVDWTLRVAGISQFGALTTSPIVVNRTVYLQDLKSDVYAVDLDTGKLIWQKIYDAPNHGPNGAGYDNGRVFVTSGDHTVAALDAKTGNEVWSRRVAPPLQRVNEQLTAHNGSVYVSTIDSEFAQPQDGTGMGTIHAMDERTGDDLWTFNTVKDGDLWGNPQINSGGGAWYPPAIDTATDTTYWGTNNAAPWPGLKGYPNGSSRPGPNLYTESELAIDRSGHLQWFNQVKAHDLFDYDFTASPILTSATVNGSSRKIIVGAGKGGYVIAFDRRTGSQIWKTAVGLHQNDQLTMVPAGQTISVAPGSYGGVETPMALANAVVYVPVVNQPTDFTDTGFTVPPVTTATGELDAIDVNTGRILWTAKLDAPDFGSALVAGDLVFTSTFAGKVLALNRASGQQVWSWQAPGSINGFIAAAGDRLLVPVGLGATPMLVSLKLGASGSASATVTATPTASSSCAPSATTLCISTSNQGNGISFNTNQLTASAGAHVTLTYMNDSAIPHNWHVFDGANASSPSIASTGIKAGPNDVESVSFTVPSTPGRYFFQCDVHPTLMTGYLVVH
ncbi:MAG TPA: PQQ-binding-like beta-propeller repeat protein [Candidatus Dormibacteraeota bacterium]|nr:PQQ-binding-like beta-propeller repeat protein [Candidatus Dormibacteraeota bacterium]